MARAFNGSTDRLDYTSVANLSDSAWSFACWAQCDVVVRATTQFLCTLMQSGDAATAIAVYLSTNGGIGFVHVASSGSNQAKQSTDGTLTTGQHHIAMSKTSNTTHAAISLYIDGTLQTSLGVTTDGGTLVSAAGGWCVGGRVSDDLRNFDGDMWDYGVWSRVLTADEIAQLYAGYPPSAVAQDALIFNPELQQNINCPWSGRAGTADGTTQAVNLGPSVGWGLPYVVKAAAAPAGTRNNLMLLGVS